VAGPDPVSSLASALLAYGPAPGLEFITYFLGLVAWVGMALAAVLLAPLSALLRRLRRNRKTPAAPGGPGAEAKTEQ
jgi:hypothetical protein